MVLSRKYVHEHIEEAVEELLKNSGLTVIEPLLCAKFYILI